MMAWTNADVLLLMLINVSLLSMVRRMEFLTNTEDKIKNIFLSTLVLPNGTQNIYNSSKIFFINKLT